MIQFDEHIFQMGWNHQLVLVAEAKNLRTTGRFAEKVWRSKQALLVGLSMLLFVAPPLGDIGSSFCFAPKGKSPPGDFLKRPCCKGWIYYPVL